MKNPNLFYAIPLGRQLSQRAKLIHFCSKMILTGILCLLMVSGQAQITEEDRSMSLGVKNALVLELPDAKGKFVAKLWKKYIKQFDGKTKRNKKADEYFTDNARMVEVGGSQPVDVYCRVDETSSDVDVILWMDVDGEFLSSAAYPEEFTEAEKILMRFALEVTREKIKIELKEEENRLKKLNKNLKKLQRANDNYHRDIEVAKAKIKKAEGNIEQNEIDQENTRNAIDTQLGVLEVVRKRLSDL